MARRKMSALQRKFFGRRSSRRAVARTVSRRRSYRTTSRRRSYGRSRISSWLPLTMSEHATAAITGVSAPLVTYGVRKVVPDSMLAPLGGYGDEVILYATAALANKFVPGGFVKALARDHARLAIMSASNQAISPMISSALGINGTSSLGGSLAAVGYI